MTTQPSAIADAIASFAESVNEDPANIGYLDINFDQLMMKGAVIRLKTGGYEGTTQITSQDMGWDEGSMSEVQRRAVRQLFRDLGKRPLVKPSIIQESKSIRASARTDIDRLTFRLFDGETRFVPEKAYEELIDKLTRHQKRYFELRDDLIANLDTYRESLRPDYEIWVRRLYSQLYGYKPVNERPEEDEWVASNVERLMILNKSPEKIESQFKFEWTVRVLPLLEDLARDQVAAQQVRVQSAVEREMVAEQTRLQRDLLAQQQRTKQEELKEFWAEVRGGLRDKLYSAMVDALAALQDSNGNLRSNLPPANVGALRRMIETINKMKFWDDADLDAEIRKVKLLINAADASSTPDTKLMGSLMQTIGAEMRLQMLDLNYRPQRESRVVDSTSERKKKTGPEVGIPETRDGLEFVINRSWREARPAVTVAAAPAQPETDGGEIVVSRQPRRSRAKADTEVE